MLSIRIKNPRNGFFWLLWMGLPIIMTQIVDVANNTKAAIETSACDQKIERLTLMIAMGLQLMIGLLIKSMRNESLFDCKLIISLGRWEIQLAASSHLKPQAIINQGPKTNVTADTDDLDQRIRLFASKAP